MRPYPRFLLVSCLVFAAATCAEDDPSSQRFSGTWVMKLGERTFLVLTLKNKRGAFTGALSRPAHFETSDGIRFSHISPARTTEVLVSGSVTDARLHFVTENSKDKDDQSGYDMTLAGDDRASVSLTGVPFGAWSFARIRDAKPPTVFADWKPQRTYSTEDGAISNAEMKTIFEADQAARQDPGKISAADWVVIGQHDAERRSRTRELLDDGQLHTGEDFTRAAFVFQHGSTSDGYLLAHTLAMIAVAKGDESALWIGTATLDRYLQHIGQPQVYGTQYKAGSDGRATQEPYNRELITDPLRRQLGVPILSAQEAQLQYWTEQFKSAAAKSK